MGIGRLNNVNFPDVSEENVGGVSGTYQGRGKLGSVLDRRVDPRGRTYYWINSNLINEANADGSDFSAIQGGRDSVTPLHINLTDRDSQNNLKEVLN